MTTINSRNSMAFGCGACAQLKKMCYSPEQKGLAKESYDLVKLCIKFRQKNGQKTHGLAASSLYALLKKDENIRKDFIG